MSLTKYDSALEQLRPAMEGKLTEITKAITEKDPTLTPGLMGLNGDEELGYIVELSRSGTLELWVEITLTDINVRESESKIKDPDAMGIQLQLCNSNGAELWNWIPGNYTEGVFTSDINQLKAKIEGINSSDVAQCALNHTAQAAEKSRQRPKGMSM